ncbi:hypothetical protein [Sagittula salina]|uniref:Lipoprotein n=1 Tax=Sagittula salina TaxID=2820268 RepID=A0A940MLY0_9RHOB|nr:hypothetical protein [Sagittula salina]MBP0481126.1 hypothetical protein [Sagittula salina]
MILGRFAALLRLVTGFAALSLLASCIFALDEEEALRVDLKRLVYLAQTRSFTSRSTCTAAIFDLASDQVRSQGMRIVSDVRSGLRLVKEGRVVAFDVPGLTPNMVSEQVMSMNLYAGLGLISSFVGPSKDCMDDQFQVDVYYALMTPDSLTIYDPERNALLLLHRPKRLLFYLRGDV